MNVDGIVLLISQVWLTQGMQDQDNRYSAHSHSLYVLVRSYTDKDLKLAVEMVFVGYVRSRRRLGDRLSTLKVWEMVLVKGDQVHLGSAPLLGMRLMFLRLALAFGRLVLVLIESEDSERLEYCSLRSRREALIWASC